MFKLYFLQGFLLGLAYVAPIGTQNMYVMNTALREKPLKTFQIALITIFFDISLALACFWGIGVLVDRFLLLKGTILFLGSIAVIFIGAKLVLAPPLQQQSQLQNTTLLTAVTTCFAITWLNPQALVDGSLLLGGIYSTLQAGTVQYFIFGVCSASFVWFMALAAMISFFKSYFNPLVLRIINIFCGSIIVFYGLKLGYSFVQLFIRFK